MIDVGQGDSIFIELPNNEVMLIDAGTAQYGTTVLNYIKKLGYTKINYLVATHPHADHIGGLEKVITNLEIEKIYMPKATTTTKTYESLLATISNKGLKINTAKAGVTVFENNDLSVRFIAPNRTYYSNLNNYSAVVKIQYKNNKFLFMGDAETLSENEITSDISADVIKVGHHGSKTSSGQSFVNRVNAKYAIISVAKNNGYNHPDILVVERWQKSGTTVYRTDEAGTIVISSDGKNISVTKGVATKKVSGSNDSGSNNNQIPSTPQPKPEKPTENNNQKNVEIKLKSLTKSVSRNQYASITIIGKPNTEYDITVRYKSGPSKANGIELKVSKSNGEVTWSWKVGGSTTRGEWPITISGGGQEKTFYFTVK